MWMCERVLPLSFLQPFSPLTPLKAFGDTILMFSVVFSAGIPQVVVSVWMDTYDFARRAEILGIGRWGNQGTELGVIYNGRELGGAIVDVLVGGRASVFAARAKELAELCKRSGGGRVIAARRILAEIEMEDTSEDEKF